MNDITSTPVTTSDSSSSQAYTTPASKKPINWVLIAIITAAILGGAVLGGGAAYYYMSANDTKDTQTNPTITPTPTVASTPTTTPTPTPISSSTPTPAQTSNLLEEYPTVKSTSSSPDGQWNLSLRTKAGSNTQAVIVSKVDGSSASLITQDPGDGRINAISNKNWSSDGKYAYLTVDKGEIIPVWLLRLDGQTIGSYGSSVLKSGDTQFGGFAMSKGFVVEPSWQGSTLKAGELFTWDASTGTLHVAAAGN